MGPIWSANTGLRRATSTASCAAHQACRSSRAGADQVRPDHQPYHRQGPRPHRAGHAARPRRRGDRMSGEIRRREFISLLGGAAAWPLAARAQQPGKLPTIGFLGSLTQSAQSTWTDAFVKPMREHGWIEGRTVAIEYRWAEGR